MSSPPQIKVVLLGESNVGKTCIVHRFVHDQFTQNSNPTLGVMYIAKVIEIPESDTIIKYHIWDTAGQEKYRSMAAIYYQDASVAILVYDMTKRHSFETLPYWISELRAKAPSNLKLVIAANKSDLIEQEVVHLGEGQKFAEKNDALFRMTSAKDGTGIIDLFLSIIPESLRLFDDRKATDLETKDSTFKRVRNFRLRILTPNNRGHRIHPKLS